MAEGHGRQAWEHTSLLCALMANVHRDPKRGRAFTPGDFDPYRRERGEVIEVDRASMETLKSAFIGRGGMKE